MNAIPAEKIDASGTLGHFIAGEYLADDNRPLAVHNPATGKVCRHVAMASAATVGKAIDAAATAFPEWRNTPPAKRARVMFRFRQLLEEHTWACSTGSSG